MRYMIMIQDGKVSNQINKNILQEEQLEKRYIPRLELGSDNQK